MTGLADPKPIRSMVAAYRSVNLPRRTREEAEIGHGHVPLDEDDYRATVVNAIETGGDAISLDLEDYVTPNSFKPNARRLVRQMLEEFGRDHLMFVRVNAVSDLENLAADLEAIVCPELYGVQLSKPETAQDIRIASALLELNERRAGVTVGQTFIDPQTGSALGVHNAFEIASASPRVAYMGTGSHPAGGDRKISIGWRWIPPTSEESLYARSHVILAARAAGVPYPIAMVITDALDLESARLYTEQCRDLGYDGMLCLAFKEYVEMVNQVFTPTVDEIRHWREADRTLTQAEEMGTIHNPCYGKLARKGLDRARRLGLDAEDVPVPAEVRR